MNSPLRSFVLPVGSIVSAALVLSFGFGLCVAPASAFTGDHPKMKVRIAWPDEERLAALRAMPDLDPMRLSPGKDLTLVSSPAQVEKLESLGFAVEVLIPDMEAYFAAQREGLRNFGELFTYSEAVAYLDEFHAAYPHITTEKFPIGTTCLGNTIWAFKVSDHPGIDEDEPEVLFDGVHHAREPITVNVLIETIRHLCENYGTDPEATFLVDERETFFVPVLNVDGYLYNESTYPQGGGMWRKNRRDNPGTSCDGVDINRNYPYQWGGASSSSDPCSDLYKGETPGSEPCVQALMNFCRARDFVTHDSYHSVAGLILFPWSYTTAHTPDDALFRQIGNTLQQSCGYTVGQPGEVLYTCSGTTTDWTYSELHMYSFTTEVDGSDFWPTDAEVPGLVAENIPKNLYLMKIAGSSLALAGADLAGGDGDGHPEAGETCDLAVTVRNEGVIASAANVAVTLATDDPYVQLHQASAELGTIAAGQSASNASLPFSFTIDPACPPQHIFRFRCRMTADNFDLTAPLEWLPVLFADGMEAGVGSWSHAPVGTGYVDQWHQSTLRNHTAGGATSWKFGDTGSGDYANNAHGELVTPAIAVAGEVHLEFWHWIEAETSSYYTGQAYDGGLIEMAVDGGAWSQVTPENGYTHIARGDGPFPAGTPLFSGTLDWRRETVVIPSVSGNVQFRFRFGTDDGVVREGWYVDDVAVACIGGGNQAPGAPLLASPFDGETVETMHPALTVQNAEDPDAGDFLTYGFRVYSDALLTDLIAAATGVGEGPGTTSWTVSASLDDGTYYWRVFADDGQERGPCMTPARFVVEAGLQSLADAQAAGGLRWIGAVPNPARARVALRMDVAREGWVRGDIYDPSGRRVRTLLARCAAGPQALSWDGRDDAGRALPGGMYLVRLRGAEEVQTGRFLWLR